MNLIWKQNQNKGKYIFLRYLIRGNMHLIKLIWLNKSIDLKIGANV